MQHQSNIYKIMSHNKGVNSAKLIIYNDFSFKLEASTLFDKVSFQGTVHRDTVDHGWCIATEIELGRVKLADGTLFVAIPLEDEGKKQRQNTNQNDYSTGVSFFIGVLSVWCAYMFTHKS